MTKKATPKSANETNEATTKCSECNKRQARPNLKTCQKCVRMAVERRDRLVAKRRATGEKATEVTEKDTTPSEKTTKKSDRQRVANARTSSAVKTPSKTIRKNRTRK